MASKEHMRARRVLGFSAIVLAVTLAVYPTEATAESLPTGLRRAADNAEACLFCHVSDELYTTLPSGEGLSLTIDANGFTDSAHGQAGLTCIDCHRDYNTYPHPPLTATNLRDYQLARYTLCQACHIAQYEAQLDGIHQRALAGGRPDAAICTDCHGAHEVSPPGEPPSRIPRTCSRCHTAIYQEYRQSVHGAALLDEANPDVPTCVDCHGVHNIGDPLTARFRLTSPETCAGCHSDPERMAPYDISTDVVETYVADFHGTTVTLFETESPGHPINQAVCFDCHSVHDIRAVDDPASPVIRENLLATCQQCHPNASQHFPEAWASHYIPTREHNPIVYYVGEFYTILLPTVGILLSIIVGADMFGWLWRALRRGDHQ